jgi:hypothetical protein
VGGGGGGADLLHESLVPLRTGERYPEYEYHLRIQLSLSGSVCTGFGGREIFPVYSLFSAAFPPPPSTNRWRIDLIAAMITVQETDTL